MMGHIFTDAEEEEGPAHSQAHIRRSIFLPGSHATTSAPAQYNVNKYETYEIQFFAKTVRDVLIQPSLLLLFYSGVETTNSFIID